MQLIRFNNQEDWDSIYINAAHIVSMQLYAEGSKKHGNECWKICLTLVDGRSFTECQEDGSERPIAAIKAQERFDCILLQCNK